MGAGERLWEERLKQGLTLEEVEEETKIRKYYLQSLEQEDYQVLPPQVYATGFVKRYAKFLGLDGSELVEQFKQEAYGSDNQEDFKQVPQQTTPLEKKVIIPWRNIMAGIIFLFLAIWIGNYIAGYVADRGTQDVQPPTPGIQQPTNPAPAPSPTPTPPPSTAPVARLDLKTNQPCWLLVVVDGESKFTGTLPAGEERSFQGTKLIYIKAGNAGGIELTFNGEKQEPLGAIGEVKDREFPAE